MECCREIKLIYNYKCQDKDKEKEKVALIIAQAPKNKEGKSPVQDSSAVSLGESELKSTVSRQDNPDSDTNTGRPNSGSEMPNNGNYKQNIE